MPSIPEYRTNIRQRCNLMHSMGDIQNCQSSISELTNDFVELFHVLRRQGGRSLIHDDKTRLPN